MGTFFYVFSGRFSVTKGSTFGKLLRRWKHIRDEQRFACILNRDMMNPLKARLFLLIFFMTELKTT